MTPATYTLHVTNPNPNDHTPITIAAVTGDIDTTNAAQFADAIRDLTGPQPLILDLNDLRYLDSAGFAALDTLLAHHTITIVLTPTSPLHKAATLVGLPHHNTIHTARTANHHTP